MDTGWLSFQNVLITAIAVAVSCLTVAAGCASESAGLRPWVAVGKNGMVASDSPYASQAGADILRDGGNAIDAAVATSFALAVTRPYSMGLGGGGFLMVRFAETGEVHILDYREMAPSRSSADMYVNAMKERPDAPAPSRFGGLAAGVPGHVAGHAALLERFGTCDWQTVLKPAYALAADGFQIDEHHADAIQSTLRTIEKNSWLGDMTKPLRRQLLFDDEPALPGAVLRQPRLAETLHLIAQEGADAFYRGSPASQIARAVQADGGIMTDADLAAYVPKWREPIRVTYRGGYEMLLMPPPSSGGVCIAEALNVLEHWDLPKIHREDPGLAAHLRIEAIKHAFADRARHLGDADFADVPVDRLISKTYAEEIALRIREDGVLDLSKYGSQIPDDGGTSHFSVVDRWGNVVAATETINTTYGSMLMVEPLGVVLNNEMDDFTAVPGKVNAFGLKQSAANEVEPGKRPLSSMSPTIVLKDGEPILSLGASGGPRIITATLQVMLDVIDSGRTLPDAVEQPRLHHQWQPNVVYRNHLDPDDPVIRGLVARGHDVTDERGGSVVQAIRITPKELTGVSDPRKGGLPIGY